jgi:hypothetical protein
LVTLGNVLHGGVVNVTSPSGDSLLLTMWWVTDVALSGVLLRCGSLSCKVARTTVVQADVVGGGADGQWHGQAQHRWRWR